MVPPARAVVKPRFVAAATGATLPLEDEVARLLDEGAGGTLILRGSAGSGKSTALAHLAAIFPRHPLLYLVDDTDAPALGVEQTSEMLVVCAETAHTPQQNVTVLRLAGWGQDEWVEYLLATARSRCAAVFAKISNDDLELLGNTPEIWRAVLDELVADDSHASATTALLATLQRGVPGQPAWKWTLGSCLQRFCTRSGQGSVAATDFLAALPDAAIRLMRHRPVQLFLASQQLAQEIEVDQAGYSLSHRLPETLVRHTARRLWRNRRAIAVLDSAYLHQYRQQPMAASLLLAIDDCWKPADGGWHLAGAYLDGALWNGVNLANADLRSTCLCYAELGNAVLDGANAENIQLAGAQLSGARLRQIRACNGDLAGASMTRVRADHALLEGANLESAILIDASLPHSEFHRANLSGAKLWRANLRNSQLIDATIDEADFQDADLTGADLNGLPLRVANFSGACLQGALLHHCDWEETTLEDVNLSEACLNGALLTSTVFTNGNLLRASLANARLADVDWEGVCLRDANLTGATFHLGSSRSGLIDSSIPCEGSRTGFYTDDSDEQDFKSPEEIRKANLCGADLRQACIAGVDFYLVDLRGALYSADQREHFARCGAILENRVRGE